jgi:hypothetical protein
MAGGGKRLFAQTLGAEDGLNLQSASSENLEKAREIKAFESAAPARADILLKR